jgi:hypothetical protein
VLLMCPFLRQGARLRSRLEKPRNRRKRKRSVPVAGSGLGELWEGVAAGVVVEEFGEVGEE